MKLDIVIVNWNAGSQLRACVESVRAFGVGVVGRCTVIDNGSSDSSADFLVNAADVELVRMGENLGFGRACNFGAMRGNSDFVLFLNPDARLFVESLEIPLRFLGRPENAEIGIAGVALVDETGDVQRTCARFPTLWSLIARSFALTRLFPEMDFRMVEWDHSETRVVDQVIGAFFLVRRKVFEGVGGFDERFFVYFEEVDFSRRAALAGFRSIYLAEARAFHKGGGVSEQVKAHRLFYSLRSRLQFAFKHFSVIAALIVSAVSLVIEPVSRFSLLLLGRRFDEVPDLVRAYEMIWRWVWRGLIVERGGGGRANL